MSNEPLLSFDAVVHASPEGVTPRDVVRLRGLELPTLDVAPGATGRGFSRSFEEVAESFERFERMFFEPDGSYVWRASVGEPPWQLDGVMYDRDGRVLYVEIKGACPAARLDEWLTALGWPQTSVMFQLVREAVFLDEPTFRRYAAATGA